MADMPTVIHTLQILEYLARYPNSRAIAIAKDLNVHKSTVSRQLAVLESKHYVLRNPETGKFRLGHTLLALGRAVENESSLRQEALPIMRKLRDQTGESVGLFVRVGMNRVCIEQVQSHDQIRRIFMVGQVEPLFPPGSVGRVLIAYMPTGEQAQFLESLRQSGIDTEQLEKDLIEIKRLGYAPSIGERIPDAAGVSAPIFDFRQQCTAALNVGIPLSRLNQEFFSFLQAQVVTAAAAVSQLQGFPGGSVFDK